MTYIGTSDPRQPLPSPAGPDREPDPPQARARRFAAWHFIGISGLTCALTLGGFAVYDYCYGPPVVGPPPEATDWSDDWQCWTPTQEESIRNTADGLDPKFWTKGQLIAKARELASKLKLMVDSAEADPDNWTSYWQADELKREETKARVQFVIDSLDRACHEIQSHPSLTLPIESKIIYDRIKNVDTILQDHGVVWKELR